MKIDPVLAWNHLDLLAARHRIIVRPVARRAKAEAHIKTRQVWVPPQRTSLDYLTGLHELGHVASAESRRHDRRQHKTGFHSDAMACETAAWVWALEHIDKDVLPRITKGDWAHLGWCLATHLRRPY